MIPNENVERPSLHKIFKTLKNLQVNGGFYFGGVTDFITCWL